MIAVLGGSPELDLRDAIIEAISTTQHECGEHGVTSMLSVVRMGSQMVEIALLGDSPVHLIMGGEIHTYLDPQFEGREETLINDVRTLYSESGVIADAYAEVEHRLRADRDKRNSDDGIWVVSDFSDPKEIARNFFYQSIESTSVDAVVVMSDGAMDAVSTFQMVELEDLIHHPDWNAVFCCERSDGTKRPGSV